ncbi:unnamed protein product [Durusdinium trenchii]|uniref:C3H1-type domain-containing protein n=1 Tax=Durusdinium trenchii TaxID=1381693 RepID=A0ABP0JAJ4_9DINO
MSHRAEPYSTHWTGTGGGQSVCRHFLQGKCTFGEACSFKHEGSAPGAMPVQGVQMDDERPVCRHFLEGKCTYAEACRFSHDAPGFQPPGSDLGHKPVDGQRPVCRHFLEGKCTYGAACSFSHEGIPMTASFAGPSPAVNADERPVCRHFLEGKCTFGDLCRFSHDAPRGPIFNSQGAEKTAVADDRSVCRHFLEGKCTFGDACRFSHALPGAHSSWGFPVDERPVCRHFLEGKCTYGHDCRFSHDAMAGRQEPWRAQPAPMKPLPLPFRLGSGLDGITIGLQLWASKDFPKGAAFSAIDSGKEETVRLERPEPGVSGTQGLWETVDNAGDRGGYRRQSQHCNWTVFLQDEDLSEDLILLGDAQNIAARSGPHFVGAGELGDWKNGVEFPQEEGSVVFCGCPSSQKNSWNLGLGAALGWYSSGMA